MCYNCGCHIPQDDMGSPDNITEQMLTTLAQSMNISIDVIKQQLLDYLSNQTQTPNPSIEEMFSKAAIAWGQSVDEAKKNTRELLTSQLKR